MTADQKQMGPGTLHFGEFRLDRNLRQLSKGSELVKLTPKPLSTLEFLIANRQRVVSKSELLSAVWGGEYQKNTVEQAVRQLRMALGDDPAHPSYIETIPGQGYRFVADLADPSFAGEAAMAPAEMEAAPRGLSRRTMAAATFGVALAGSAFAAFRSWRSPAPLPQTAVLSGNLLTVMDGLRRPLWTHEFRRHFRQPVDTDSWQSQVLDLEGTGRPGVLVTCNFVDSGSSQDERGNGELHYFSSEGQIKWVVPADPGLRDFDGRAFEPSWNYSHVIATPEGRGYTIWAAVKHGFRWPGCILRIDSQGKSRVQFANAGNLEHLCFLERPGGSLIAFDGENNGADRTCAGVLKVDGEPASSPPIGPARYRFSNGPQEAPAAYITFPTVELAAVRQVPYGFGGAVFAHANGVVVTVDYWERRAYVEFELTDELEPVAAAPCGSYPAIHAEFEQKGLLHHSWKDCPETSKPLTLRRFASGTGWQDREMPWRLPTNLL